MELTHNGMPRAILILSLLVSASCGSEEDETPDAPRDSGTPAIPSDAGASSDARANDVARDASTDAGADDPSPADSGEEDGEDADGEDDEDAGSEEPVDRPDTGTGDAGGEPDSGSEHVPSAANGEVLAIDNNCASCHGLNYAGFEAGTAIAYPNITPHNATGIGTWTDAQIAAAINLGQSPDGALCIIMQRYGFTDEDTADLVAYLRALTPVNKRVADLCQ